MERKIKVRYQDKMRDAIELDFKAKKEEWNEYEIVDGSTIRMKLVITAVARTDEYDAEGNPVYVIKSSNVVNVSVPENLKKEPLVS